MKYNSLGKVMTSLTLQLLKLQFFGQRNIVIIEDEAPRNIFNPLGQGYQNIFNTVVQAHRNNLFNAADQECCNIFHVAVQRHRKHLDQCSSWTPRCLTTTNH